MTKIKSIDWTQNKNAVDGKLGKFTIYLQKTQDQEGCPFWDIEISVKNIMIYHDHMYTSLDYAKKVCQKFIEKLVQSVY